MWTSWGNGSCSNNIWNTNKHQCWTPKEIWSAPELTVIIIQEQLSVFTCMMSCELGMLNSSEARTCSWVAMSCRTTARLIRPSPTTSSYWAGRMCCLITLAAENGGKYSTPSHLHLIFDVSKSGWEHTFHGWHSYSAVCFPEGVRWATVVLFHLCIEVDLQLFSNFLPVNRGHGETDGFPCNWSFIQGQENCYPIGWACEVKIKTIGTSDDVGLDMKCD